MRALHLEVADIDGDRMRIHVHRGTGANGLYASVDPAVWELGFNVNCISMTESHHSVRYLAPYVFKVAISNTRITRVENRRVFFKYKKKNSNRWRTTALHVFEFIRRFLQHVLPAGFMKVRYFGFMHPCSSVKADTVKTLIEIAFGFEIDETVSENKPTPGPVCSKCGGRLIPRYVGMDRNFNATFQPIFGPTLPDANLFGKTF